MPHLLLLPPRADDRLSSRLYALHMSLWKRPPRGDLLLAAAISAFALAESLTVHVQAARPLAVMSLLILSASLAWRTALPMVPVVTAALFVPAQAAAGVPDNAALTTLIVIMLTAYSAGAHLAPRLAALAAGLLVAAGVISVLLGHRALLSNVIFVALVVLAPWGAGLAMRTRLRYSAMLEEQAHLLHERAAWLEQRAEQAAAAAVAQERARIARELHDVISHSLTVIGLQAGGVRRLLQPGQEKERDALLLVEQTGRQAQEDMRHLVSLMRVNGDGHALTPQPGLRRLAALLADSRAAGLTVDCSVTGDAAALPPGVDLTAYRIAQEALTNVRKHSDGTHVTVRVDCTPGMVRIEIADNGQAPGPDPGGTARAPGHGLVGMRERTAMYGGTLDAGPLPEGGFLVAATLPYRVDPVPVSAPEVAL